MLQNDGDLCFSNSLIGLPLKKSVIFDTFQKLQFCHTDASIHGKLWKYLFRLEQAQFSAIKPVTDSSWVSLRGYASE
jgi:hypothetical protein